MAKNVLGPNSKVTINGTDLSQFCTSVTVEDSSDEVEDTGMGQVYRSFRAGLKDATFTTTFQQSYGASEVDAVVGALYYGTAAGTVKFDANTTVSAAGGTSVYTLIARPYTYSPVQGGLGELQTTDVTWRNAGTVGLTRGST